MDRFELTTIIYYVERKKISNTLTSANTPTIFLIARCGKRKSQKSRCRRYNNRRCRCFLKRINDERGTYDDPSIGGVCCSSLFQIINSKFEKPTILLQGVPYYY